MFFNNNKKLSSCKSKISFKDLLIPIQLMIHSVYLNIKIHKSFLVKINEKTMVPAYSLQCYPSLYQLGDGCLCISQASNGNASLAEFLWSTCNQNAKITHFFSLSGNPKPF